MTASCKQTWLPIDKVMFVLRYDFNAVRRRKGRQWESIVIQVRDGDEIVSNSEEGGNSDDDDNEGNTDRTYSQLLDHIS